MPGGIPLRSITAVAAISLLALASFGIVLVFEILVTADEALHHAEDVDDPYELREAFETDDRVTIAKYTKRYPKLWVF